MKRIRLTAIALAIFAFLSALAGTATAETPVQTAAEWSAIGQAPNTVKRFTLHDLDGHQGSCITFYGYGGCTTGYHDREGLYALRDYGFDNKTTSLETFNQCDVRLYDSWNCPSQGAQTGWLHNSYDLISWSNRAGCVLVS